MSYFETRQAMKAFGTLEKEAPKPKYVIPKESKKRIKEKPIYRKIVKAKIEESDGLCVLKGPTCSIYAEGGDHLQNRSPDNYADPDNIVPSCNACNTLKVRFPKLFPGHVISKFAKKKIPALLATHDTELNATIIEPA